MTSHHQLVETHDQDTIIEQIDIGANYNNNLNDRDINTQHTSENLNNSENKASVNSTALNKIPKRLLKTFYVSLSLFILGILMIILGIEEVIRKREFNAGVTYLVIGGIVSIPGCYYIYQFYKARRCEDLDDKNEIYGEIPEL
jgi:uncharacterized membrane-anchored protein